MKNAACVSESVDEPEAQQTADEPTAAYYSAALHIHACTRCNNTLNKLLSGNLPTFLSNCKFAHRIGERWYVKHSHAQ